MIFKRKRSTSTGRRRLQAEPAPKPANKKFLYRSQRAGAEANVGRQIERSAPKSPNRLSKLFQKTGMFILLLAVIASAANIISLSANPKVLPLETNTASSDFLRDMRDYQAYASQLLGGSVWNRNKITVNTTDVSQKLVKEFPELASASVTVPLLAHRPIVYIQPAKPVLVIVAKNGAFVAADSGKALLRADKAAELSKYRLPQLKDDSGLKLQVGRQALQTKDVGFIQTIITELTSKQIQIDSFTLPAASSELDVKLVDRPYIVKFNLQSDTARQQAGTFLSTMAYLAKQNVVPTKYVDVRVDSRAYYQ